EQPKAPDDITQAPQASTEETLSAEINKPQERKVTGEDLKTKLGIDDININPTSRTEAPREANPGQIPRPSVSNKTIINPAPASGPAPNQTISEMDI
ncbi:hypothetical protein K0A96_02935, partial [Patescibacteria group bacterium]|nr:hypothetical protein [Patescibacteria group bacterium]